MGLMTAQEYLESLHDGRIVYYLGEKIENVAQDPNLGVCARTMALDYEIAEDPKYKDLATVYDEELGETISRYYHKPQNGEELIKAHDLIVTSTNLGDGIIPFSHDIGSDALNAYSITAQAIGNPEYIQRVENYRTYLKQKDLATCAAVTDVKGDRMLRPSHPGQAHPDQYLRVVEKNDKGIIVRGAKMHITGAAYSNEILVLPCRAMTEKDVDYAVAFAIPANTPGLTQICRPFKSKVSSLEFPNTRQHFIHTDSLIVFDDVLVPWERVFMCGEWEHAATMVYNFALLHRRTGVAYRIPMSEQLAGVAMAMAEYNGVSQAPHVREKLTDLLVYLETLRSLSRSACLDFVMRGGMAVPNPVVTNIAKYHFASKYHDMVKIIQDLAGGALVTSPTYKDFQVPEIKSYIEKYMIPKNGISGEQRMRMMDLIRRILPAENETICLHGEGSPMAERMTIFLEGRRTLAQCMKLVETQAQVG
ncbi:Vinylacetyl-CoA Delta-isomerase [Desulfatibacillum aliphaticivorans]|uniref:Vinylacetyl-CoA Delta-isomerase n=1 Tax=Desulfatibacillum aliphaticivorans TaxID=218208 RepID=B8FLD4_DESAL|nr:4-hydroxyphenylacetate 3-hydroxylase N-terminal domain-containing protein [Desulfatibacillum aliphaticivorans]ACL05080.1 Vinylacetyl-CoA Delta-isomerase [Desulfatibacillum aliphaticivorans]